MKADKRAKMKGCKMNSLIAGIDLENRESLATVLSPIGGVADRFSFPMNEEGYAYFASGVGKDDVGKSTATGSTRGELFEASGFCA